MQKTLLTWVLFLVLLSGGGTALAQGTQPGRIVIARISGAVTLTSKSDNVVRPAINNEQISAGYIVITAPGASVVLIFSNGATVNLRGDSVLDIETFLQDPFAQDFKVAEATAEPSTSTTRLNLTRGELIGNVKKLNAADGSSFNIQTPVGAAGIRGTTFRIIFRPDGQGTAQFSVTTIEGNVVLLVGEVEIPVDATSGEPREINVQVRVQVDPVSGLLTVQLAGQTFVTQVAPAATTAAILQAVQQVISAVAAQVFSPVGAPAPGTGGSNATQGQGPGGAPGGNEPPPGGSGTPGQPGQGGTTGPGGSGFAPPPPPPPPLPPPPRTTTGDGSSG